MNSPNFANLLFRAVLPFLKDSISSPFFVKYKSKLLPGLAFLKSITPSLNLSVLFTSDSPATLDPSLSTGRLCLLLKHGLLTEAWSSSSCKGPSALLGPHLNQVFLRLYSSTKSSPMIAPLPFIHHASYHTTAHFLLGYILHLHLHPQGVDWHLKPW